MSGHNLGAALLASLDDQTLHSLAERLRPYLTADPDDRPLLTPAQAGERLRLHPKTVVRMARDGRLQAVKVGTGWRFHPDQLHITPPTRPTPSKASCSPPRRRHAEHEPASVRAIRGHRERSAT
jgi:excisionase family DNA binding protein